MTDYERHALEAILGLAAVTVFRAREVIQECKLTMEDFDSFESRKIFVHVMTVESPDKLDVAHMTDKMCLLPDFVASLWAKRSISGAHERFKLLKDRTKRKLYADSLRTIYRLLSNTDAPLADGLSEAAKVLESWKSESANISTLDSNLFALIDELEAVQQGKKTPTLETGLEAWDALIGGLQPTLTVIGGLPGIGKGALCAGMIRKMTSRGVKVGLCSLEDERGWLTRRLLSNAARVPLFVLANKPLTKGQMDRIGEASEPVYHLLSKCHVEDRSGLRTTEVVASCREMIAAGCRAVFVDHLGEIAMSRTDRHDLDIADALRELRTIAKTTRVPVVVFSHLKRREGLHIDTEPKLTDFAFSSGVERMARVAVGLYRDGESLRCAVLKQTQGIANVNFELVLDSSSGVVIESPASPEALRAYAS